MKFEDIIKTKDEIMADGNSIENTIIIDVDIKCIGHFGNAVCLNILSANGLLYDVHNNTDNIGWQFKALVELFGLTNDDGFLLSEFKNIPCRIITYGSGGYGSTIIGFGHFMKDKFVYTKDFAKVRDL